MDTRSDFILEGGQVIDPGQNLNGLMDVAVKDGKIVAIGESVGDAKETINVAGRIVIPGMIDTHAHVFQHIGGPFGLNADLVGVQSGVTTLVDQGGPSSMTFAGFRHYIVEPADTNVVAFISAYVVGGLEGHYYTELYSPDGVDVAATVRVINANRDLAKGIKAHAEIGGFARWGFKVIEMAKDISTQSGLPIYIHLGQLWPLPDDPNQEIDPDIVIPEVVKMLAPGDILAHPFTRHPGGFVDTKGNLHPSVREALDKGIKVDVGHGSHFSFDMAKKVLEAGVVPHTLGADMHGYNTKVPEPDKAKQDEHLFSGDVKFSMTHAMTELVALGMPLDDVIATATSNAAAMLNMTDEIGTMKPGMVADITVLADERGKWVLRDNSGDEVVTDRYLRPDFCLRAGKRFDADAIILPQLEAAA